MKKKDIAGVGNSGPIAYGDEYNKPNLVIITSLA
jgi:hypothetical protein